MNTTIKLSVLAIFLISSPVQADWTESDANRETVFLVLASADWLQTREIAKGSPCAGTPVCEERWNPFLGPHPSTQEVDLYFAGWMLGHVLIAQQLTTYRPWWQAYGIAVHVSAVAHNYRIGIRARF